MSYERWNTKVVDYQWPMKLQEQTLNHIHSQMQLKYHHKLFMIHEIHCTWIHGKLMPHKSLVLCFHAP